MANPTPPTQTPVAVTNYQRPPTLEQIQIKVRRLTRSPSEAQLTTADLNNYINTSVVYDFPEILRTFNLLTQFSFFTNPGQDVYNTDIASFAGNTTNPLYNFQNLYLTINPPVYVAGYQVMWSQSQEQLFNIYPKINSIASIGTTGDAVTTQFTGVINSQQALIPSGLTQQISLLQGEVLFSSVAVNGEGCTLVDVPVVDATTGYKTNIGNLYDPNSAAYQAALVTPPTTAFSTPFANGTGVINYLTGAFTINFTSAPATGVAINSQTVPTVRSLPQAVMFYSNAFTVRPVPDQPYKITFEVYQRPTALLSTSQAPELEEYWQYISYLAALKIFQDRMDLESAQMIMPELNRQERFCLRRTLVQKSNERVATIYSQQTSVTGSMGWNSNGGQF